MVFYFFTVGNVFQVIMKYAAYPDQVNGVTELNNSVILSFPLPSGGFQWIDLSGLV